MSLFTFEGVGPTISPDAWVAPTATVIGDVTIEAGASIWYNAVLRGDIAPIVIKSGANIQDCAVLHGAPGGTTYIGQDATVAHLCLVHGAYVDDGALIANGTTVLDGARIGAGSLVAAHSMVSANAQIGPGMLAAGAPAVEKRPLAGTAGEELVKLNGPAYAELARRHAAGLALVDAS
jgi:carbonic anhydrase/acetyltransferase-like protein (isoleucine patch superfamily)